MRCGASASVINRLCCQPLTSRQLTARNIGLSLSPHLPSASLLRCNRHAESVFSSSRLRKCTMKYTTLATSPYNSSRQPVLASSAFSSSTVLAPLNLRIRSFHSSRANHDVFFVSAPAFKQALLGLLKATLVLLPVAWRWGAFKRWPKQASRLWQIPLALLAIVISLGLHQSPKTARWKLLLMSEREELEWSNARFEELIATEEILLLPPEDPRVLPVKNVITRLIQSLNDDQPLSCVQFPREQVVDRLKDRKRRKITPSAQTELAKMPFLPESSNPEKIVPRGNWEIFCVDLPKINAFVLPSKDIFVYSGLLEVVQEDENLLAAVLAHEIEHVLERHIVEGLGFLALSGVLFDVLRGTAWALTLSFPMIGDGLSAAFTYADRTIGQRAYSRKLETEADVLGIELMARAGFDPRAALSLWEILNQVEKDVQELGAHGSILDHIALLRTHPTGTTRLEALKSHLPAAIKIYEETIKTNSTPTKLAQNGCNQSSEPEQPPKQT